MRLLLLGGTIFLGRAVTDAALAAGHDVGHFHRGRSAADDPRVRTIHGDRTQDADLARLGDGWDAVIDTSGYSPQHVAKSAAALAGVARYVFVSSISAYAGPTFEEGAPLQPVPDPLPAERTPQTYGALKAGCEAVVQQTFAARATIVRPGLIVGPHDPTDRFTYWPVRIARGGRVLAPGRPERRVQVIDARDLGAWLVRLAVDDRGGTFNATGPREPIAMGELLAACVRVTGSGARLAWIDEDTLARHGVQPWGEMPLWIPASDPLSRGFLEVPIARALAAGLTLRPIERTIADTVSWAARRDAAHAWKAGLAADKEAAVLAG